MQELGYESHNFWNTMDIVCILESWWVAEIIILFLVMIPLVWILKKFQPDDDQSYT